MTNTCLKAGLHVYCEKMMSNTIEGARSMVQTMRETGKLLQIGHQRRSNPRYVFTLNRLLHDAQVLRPAHRRAGTVESGSQRGFRLAQEIRDAREHAGKVRLQGHAPVPQLALVQRSRRRSACPTSGRTRSISSTGGSGTTPKSVVASGGLDYFKNHDWYDNAMVIYEYPLAQGVARAFYQVQTTTSAGGGYFESFMGDDGTIKMSEDPSHLRHLS